jgi:hypothetical protein
MTALGSWCNGASYHTKFSLQKKQLYPNYLSLASTRRPGKVSAVALVIELSILYRIALSKLFVGVRLVSMRRPAVPTICPC